MKMRIIQFVTFTLTSFVAMAADAATSSPTASELLDKFAATQEQLKSFIAQCEIDRQDTGSGSLAWNGSHHESGETRLDGQRCSSRERLWGQIAPSLQRPRDKPYYKSCLLDGQWRYQYGQSYWRPEDVPKGDQDGLLIVGGSPALPSHGGPSPSRTNPVELLGACASGLGLCLGALPGDGKRFDAQIRDAASLRVRDKLEPVGAEPSPCYVLDADTPEGQYTIWLDPAHGFQMAKAILLRRPGHRRSTWTLLAGERDLGTVDKVRFAKKGGVWVPVEASGGRDNTYAKVGNSAKPGSSSMRFQIKVTQFILNPDHKALRSFLPDDIRNGSLAYYTSATDASGGLITAHWRDGKIVDKAGNVVFDSGLGGASLNKTNPVAAPSGLIPQHGYLIAKAEYHVKAGDFFNNHIQKTGTVMDFKLYGTRFKKVNDTWVTVAGTEESNKVWLPDGYEHYKESYAISEITLQPDFSTMPNAFALEDVHEGAKVRVAADRKGNFVWRNGKIQAGP